MDAEMLDAACSVARELHPSNLSRLEARLAQEAAGPASLTALSVELSQAPQREALSRLAKKWRAAPATQPSAIAAAIAAFRHSAARETRAEVCWSGPVASLQGFRTTAEAYREIIGSATKSALVVSFAIKEVAHLRTSLEEAIGRGVQVRMVLEDFNVFKQESWKDQISNLGPFVCEKATLFVWPAGHRRSHEGRVFGSMHVKALAVDGKRLLLTSANWSGAAMQDNMELGVALQHEDTCGSVVRHFDLLISNGTLARYAP